jgi:hypothetical protein
MKANLIKGRTRRTAQNLPLHNTFHQAQFGDRFPDQDQAEYQEGMILLQVRSQML